MIFQRGKLIPFVFLLLCSAVTARMPGWKFFMDGEGNSYYINPANRIIITEKIDNLSRPVSVRGLDYYSAVSKELLKNHRPIDALRIARTILAMEPFDMRIVRAQEKASQLKSRIMRRNGTRFVKMNRLASPLLYRNSHDRVVLVNENMHYSFETTGMVTVIRKRVRVKPSYIHQGVLLGISFEKMEKQKNDIETVFDCLMAVDAEKFGQVIASLEELEKSWERRIILTSGNKKIFLKKEKAVVYRYTVDSTIRYSGYEGYIINGNIGYAWKIIAPAVRMNEIGENIKNLADSLKISRISSR